MSNPESTHKQARLGCTDAESVRIDDAEVIKRGQITIEKKHRSAHNLTIGDYVDIKLYADSTEIQIPDVRIGESGRVTIPARQRDRYDINVGDIVDVLVLVN